MTATFTKRTGDPGFANAQQVTLFAKDDGELYKQDAGNPSEQVATLSDVDGEDNTASNAGAGGVGLVLPKSGVNLPFKSINAGSSKITVTDDVGNNEVDIDVVEANLNLGNMGGSITLSEVSDSGALAALDTVGTLEVDDAAITYQKIQDISAPSLLLGRGSASGAGDVEQITLGSNLTMTGLELNTLNLGEDNTASNIGAFGFGLFKQKTGVDLEFKNLNVGSNKLSITNDVANDEIDYDVVEGNLNLANMGGQVGLGQVEDDAIDTDQLADDAVDNIKLNDMPSNTIKGNDTALTANPKDLTTTEVRTLINVEDGATANSTDAFLLSRANHTGTQTLATISDSGALAALNTVSTTEIDDAAVTFAKIQNISAASRLLGRGSAAGAGDAEEITLGTGLSMAGTTLNAALAAAAVSFDDSTAMLGVTDVQAMGDALEKKAPRTVTIIRTESDFPAPILALDGIMRIPLDKSNTYIIDTPNLTLTTPFWLQRDLLDTDPAFTGTFIFSTAQALISYTGTGDLFYGRQVAYVQIDKLLINNDGPDANKFYNITGHPTVLGAINLSLSTFQGFSLGIIDSMFIHEFITAVYLDYKAPLMLHNVLNIRTTLAFPISLSSINNTFLSITGAILNHSIDDWGLSLFPGESFVAIDKNVDHSAGFTTFDKNSFSGSANTSFFQLDLTGSITQVDDLSLLISGTSTLYEDDGSGNVLVTYTGTFVYKGARVTHSGTTSYNGTHNVIKEFGINQYVMDATYVGPDETSGTFVGDGIRVTTSAPHIISTFRTTDITGSTEASYNQNNVVVLNASGVVFDVASIPFVVTATASYSTQSLDQTNLFINAQNNGALENSKKTISINLPTQETVTITQGIYAPIAGTSWVEGAVEEFTSTNAGMVTYIGISPKSFLISSAATVSKVGGGSDAIASRIRLNGPATSGSITVFADSAADPGVDTTVTSTAHGFSANNRKVTISATTNYNGTFSVTRIVDVDNFDINTAFVGDDATGSFVTEFTDIAESQGQTENATPTQVAGFLESTLTTGDMADLSVTNITGSSNVVVDLATLILN